MTKFVMAVAACVLAASVPAAADLLPISIKTVYPGGTVADLYDGKIKGVVGEIDGVPYYYVEGGIGVFVARDPDAKPGGIDLKNIWRVICNQDAMTDDKGCIIETSESGIDGNQSTLVIGGDSICVPFSDGLTPMVRIDRNPPFSAEDRSTCFSSENSKAILKEMLRGKSLKIRYGRYPADSSKDMDIFITGLPQAYIMLHWWQDLNGVERWPWEP